MKFSNIFDPSDKTKQNKKILSKNIFDRAEE